jgi:hypothetical protein
MRNLQARDSVGRRTLTMSLAWLIVGAMVGSIGGLQSGRVIEIVTGMLSAMIVLPIVGLFLGLIGGDAKGSVVGAVASLLGCWISLQGIGIPIDVLTMKFMVILGALAGATCLLYLHFTLWTYKTIFLTIRRLFGGLPMFDKLSARANQTPTISRAEAYSAHFNVPPGQRRSRREEVSKSD